MFLRNVFIFIIVFCLSACSDGPLVPPGDESESYCDYLRFKLESQNFIEEPMIKPNPAEQARIIQEYHFYECDVLMAPLPK